MKRIWRKVVVASMGASSGTRHSRPQVVLTLECGHHEFRPFGQKAPAKVICLACEVEQIRVRGATPLSGGEG